MRAVITPTTLARVAHRLRTAAFAAVLACASSGAYAAHASVSADLFVDCDLSTTLCSPFGGLFVISESPNQAWDLNVLTNGALVQNKSGNFPDWNIRSDATTLSPKATAKVDSRQNASAFGTVITPGFSLQASATPPPPSGLYEALGLMDVSGSFCLWDPTIGDPATPNCNAAGTLMFTLPYSLLIDLLPGGGTQSAYADISVTGSGVPGGFLFDSTLFNMGDLFTWTETLTGAGDVASFDITGTVYASAVPEPSVLVLVALGLIGLAATRRPRGTARSAA